MAAADDGQPRAVAEALAHALQAQPRVGVERGLVGDLPGGDRGAPGIDDHHDVGVAEAGEVLADGAGRAGLVDHDAAAWEAVVAVDEQQASAGDDLECGVADVHAVRDDPVDDGAA